MDTLHANPAITELTNCKDSKKKPLLIAAYGDSTMQGSVDDPAVSVPSRLQAMMCNVTILNEGVGGTRSDQLLDGTDRKHKPWAEEMAQSKADIVIINHGINDTYTGNESLAAYKKTMRALVRIAKVSGKRVVLQTPNPVYTSDKPQGVSEPKIKLNPDLDYVYHLSFKRHEALQKRVAVIKKIAADEKLPVIDANAVMLKLTQTIPLSEAYLGVHPMPIGYEAIAKEAAKVLSAMQEER